MDCTSCGAPLDPKSRLCRYCGALADVDLRQVDTTRLGSADRVCPRCLRAGEAAAKVTMQALRIEVGPGVVIDRCSRCHGIFFDPGELEAVLEAAESSHQQIDHQRLAVILDEEAQGLDLNTVAYVPCPECSKLMNRQNFGARSGVIVDRCRDHGVWLDGGELRQLVEWARAGGQAFDARRKAETVAMEQRAQAQRVAGHTNVGPATGSFSGGGFGGGGFEGAGWGDMNPWDGSGPRSTGTEVALRVLGSLFRGFF